MSLARRSFATLLSLSPTLRVFFCHGRFSSSTSGGAEEPPPRSPENWVIMVSAEENLETSFKDFMLEFKKLRDDLNIIRDFQPMASNSQFHEAASDWVMLSSEEKIQSTFEDFLLELKEFWDKFNSFPEEKLQRIFEDFLLEFKKLRDKFKSIQAMASTFTPGKKHIVPLADLVPLYEEQFEKLFENFKFGYKKLKDENVEITASEIMSWLQHMTLRSDVDVPPPPKHQVCKDDVKKIEEWTHRTWRTQYIMGRIKTEVLFMLMIYYSIIDNTSTSDTMKEVNDQMNVLRDLYIKLGEPFEEHPTEYFRIRKELSVMTQKVISILAFVRWMETGTPLLKSTAVEKMGWMFKFLYILT